MKRMWRTKSNFQAKYMSGAEFKKKVGGRTCSAACFKVI